MSDINYTRTEKLVHRLALQPRAVRELSFDLDQSLGGALTSASEAQHVFIAGLARAGTSILLQTLYASHQFSTLTYRNMPFVLAPRLWGRISSRHQADAVAIERAHGDGLDVDFDSPESFEEVFWLTFADEQYRRTDHLVPHQPNNDTIKKFRNYVAGILAAAGSPSRYLSKNNNNVLRLGALAKAFPQSTILIPFREPLQQAASLQNQHQRFLASQGDDAFVRDYMSWLGHFEFGSNHLPLRGPDAVHTEFNDPSTLDYWCANWHHNYSHVLNNLPGNAILVDYDHLCAEPQRVLEALFSALELDNAQLLKHAEQFAAPPARELSAPHDSGLMISINDLYHKLQEKRLS